MFREWLEYNYNELNNLYYHIIDYKNNSLNKKKFLDYLSKEDFFIFMYKNTNKYYLNT